MLLQAGIPDRDGDAESCSEQHSWGQPPGKSPRRRDFIGRHCSVRETLWDYFLKPAGSVPCGEKVFQQLALGVGDVFRALGEGGMLLSKVVLEIQVAKSLLEMQRVRKR